MAILIVLAALIGAYLGFHFLRGFVLGWKSVKPLPPPDWYEIVWGDKLPKRLNVPGKKEYKRPKFTVV